MKSRRWITAVIVVAVVTIVGVGGYVVWQGTGAARAEVETPTGETATVLADTLQVTVNANGSLSPAEEVSLAYASGGTITEVLVEEGDVVAKGDVLARLDDTDVREAIADAELQVRQAEINLDQALVEVEAGIKQANLDAARDDLEQALTKSGTTDDQLTSAAVRLRQAYDSLEEAQEDYDSAWDEARDWEEDVAWLKPRLEADREATERALDAAKDELTLARASNNLAIADVSDAPVRNAEIQLMNAQIALDGEPLQIQQLELALEQAQRALASAQRGLEDLVVVAPIDGTVTGLNAKAGEMAGMNQAAAVLSDLAALEAHINLDETDVARVQIGQEAVVSVDAFPEARLAGEVSFIAPVAETKSGVVLYPVRVALSSTELPVRSGMTAGVDIVMVSREDALVVPIRAIHSEDGGSFVWLLAPDGLERVPVELGVMTETLVEIVGGLSEGDVVSVVPAPTDDGPRGFGPGMMFGGGDE